LGGANNGNGNEALLDIRGKGLRIGERGVVEIKIKVVQLVTGGKLALEVRGSRYSVTGHLVSVAL
jgi:hypothetical protein